MGRPKGSRPTLDGEPRIVISYRRADVPALSAQIFEGLKDYYGEDNVFMDVDSIELGVDFVEELERF